MHGVDILMECIQTFRMKKKPSETGPEDSASLSLRLKGAEAVRYNRLWITAKLREPFLEKTDMIRELLGLSPLTYLTQPEIDFFRTGDKVEPKRTSVPATTKAKFHATKETKESKVG